MAVGVCTVLVRRFRSLSRNFGVVCRAFPECVGCRQVIRLCVMFMRLFLEDRGLFSGCAGLFTGLFLECETLFSRGRVCMVSTSVCVSLFLSLSLYLHVSVSVSVSKMGQIIRQSKQESAMARVQRQKQK